MAEPTREELLDALLDLVTYARPGLGALKPEAQESMRLGAISRATHLLKRAGFDPRTAAVAPIPWRTNPRGQRLPE